MSWTSQDPETRVEIPVSKEQAFIYDEARREGKPIVEREAARGQMPLEPVKYQPVKSPGIYEAEFASRDGDLIFHFWPAGYHLAERTGLARPRFGPEFADALKKSMEEVFDANRLEIDPTPENGSWYVKARSWGKTQFWFELATKACEKVHYRLGGS